MMISAVSLLYNRMISALLYSTRGERGVAVGRGTHCHAAATGARDGADPGLRNRGGIGTDKW